MNRAGTQLQASDSSARSFGVPQDDRSGLRRISNQGGIVSKKFIPNGDQDFATMAGAFAANIRRDPDKYHVPADEAEQLAAAVDQYKAALQKARTGERSTSKTRAKELARAEAEQIIRRIAHLVRA